MITFLKRIHRIYSVGLILLLSALFYPLFYWASRKPERYGILNRLRKINGLLWTSLTGVFFKFKFAAPLDKNQTYIYCANHASTLDIIVFCCLAKGRFHFMGKDELLKNPVLKLFFRTIDIPVNRDSKMSSFRAFKRASENLESGMGLIIFPEGRISDEYPPKLQDFKNGPFRLAIEKHIPIVPVSLQDIWKRMWDDGATYGTSPGVGHIYVHEPILTTDLTIDDTDQLKDRIFDLINSKLN